MSQSAERIRVLIAEPIKSAGYELVDVEYKKEGQCWVLRLLVDHPNGIQTEDCVKVTHLVDPVLDAEDPLSDPYTLEVSSPGIFRPLNCPEHFRRFHGERVRVHLFQKIEGVKKAVGTLQETTDTGVYVELEAEEQTLFFPFSLISKANLEPELDF